MGAVEPIEPPVVGNMPRWARVLLRGKPLTEVDLVMIWERSEGRCAVSGLEFSSVGVGMGRARHPFMPSFDQIEPGKGYSADNVRLVCVAANFAMNAWGLDTLIQVARGVIKKAAGENADPEDYAWYARQDARIREAEQVAESLSGESLRRQRARIAALKRARTLGPAGLKQAAKSAIAARAGNLSQATVKAPDEWRSQTASCSRLSENSLWQSRLPYHGAQIFRANLVAQRVIGDGNQLDAAVDCALVATMASDCAL